MPRRPPTLRQHSRGQFFVRWAGHDYYFGTDVKSAEAAFYDPSGEHPGALVNWQRWCLSKPPAARSRPGRSRVAELVRAFCDHYDTEGRRSTGRWYRRNLGRFDHIFGRMFVDEVDVAYLAAYKGDLAASALQPKTIAHHINAVKTCWRWGVEMAMVPPLDLTARAVRAPTVMTPEPVWYSTEQRRAMFAEAQKANPTLEIWMAIQYLALLRPSEVPRVIAAWRAGTFVQSPGVPFRSVLIIKAKTDHQGWPRYVWLSDAARQWLDSCHEPPPPRRDWRYETYSRHVATLTSGSAKGLQKSAASDLRAGGATREDVNLLLGHAPRLVDRTYVREAHTRLLEVVARLTL
jgi:hypothetical protein